LYQELGVGWIAHFVPFEAGANVALFPVLLA
jgi:hypothetical protein